MTKYRLTVKIKAHPSDVNVINSLFIKYKLGPNNFDSKREATFLVDDYLLILLQQIADKYNKTKIQIGIREHFTRGNRRLIKNVKKRFDKPDYKPGGNKAEVTLP